VAHSFICVIVQIDVRDFDFARWQRIGIDTEAVILGGYFHFLREEILYRVIRSVMPEFQLESAAAEGETAQLVTETDTKDWETPQQLADVLDGVGNRLRVAGAVGQENPIRLHRENVVCGSFRRNHSDIAAMVNEEAQNVLLDAVIVGYNSVATIARSIS